MNNEEMNAEGVRWPDDKGVFRQAWRCYREDFIVLWVASGATAMLNAFVRSQSGRLGEGGYHVLALAVMLVTEIGLYKLCWDIWYAGKTRFRELLYVFLRPKRLISAAFLCLLLLTARVGRLGLETWLSVLGGVFLQSDWGRRLVGVLFLVYLWYVYFRLFPAKYLLVSGQKADIWQLLRQCWQITRGLDFDVLAFYWGIFWRTFLVSLPLVFWADPFTVPVVYHFWYDLLIVPYIFLAHAGFAEELVRFAEEKRGKAHV